MMDRVRTLIGLVQEGSLCVLLFLLPFSKAAIEILFGVLFLTWLIERLDPKTRSETLWLRASSRPLLLAMGGFLTVCALSIVVSTHPALSLKAFFSKWLEYLLFFVVVADIANRARVVRRSLRVMAWGSMGVVFEALTQERYSRGFFRSYRLDFFGRMTGPYENPIDLATYFMVIICLLLAYAVTRPKASRWPLWLLLSILVVCLARTEAVGGWVGLGVGLLLMAAWKSPVRRIALIFLAVGTLSAGFFLSRPPHPGGAISMSDIGIVDRWHMWQAAIGMIRDRPVLGQGLNTFMANYLNYWVGGERQPRYAHNCYLQVAAETGILGLLTFVGLLALLFARLVEGLRRTRSREQTMLLGFTAGLLTFALQAGIDTNFYSLRQAVLFWVVSGLAVGLSLGQVRTSGGSATAAGKHPGSGL